MRLSVIIAARNEESRLPPTLEAVARHIDDKGMDAEVIVVDAGSTDSTAAVAESFRPRFARLSVLAVEDTGIRCNKGLAIRRGMLAATGDVRCFIDADNGAPFSQIERLLGALDDADVVIGSRYVPGGDPGRRSVTRMFVSRAGNLVFRFLLGVPQRDTHCPLKLFRAAAADALFSRSLIDGLGFDAEILAIAPRLGLRVAEVPVAWRAIEGSKVGWATIIESLTEVRVIRRNLASGAYRIPAAGEFARPAEGR